MVNLKPKVHFFYLLLLYSFNTIAMENNLDELFDFGDISKQNSANDEIQPTQKRKSQKKKYVSNKRAKSKNSSWIENFPEDFFYMKFSNDENLFILEAHLEMIIGGKDTKTRYVKRYIDNRKKNYRGQVYSLGSDEAKEAWKSLDMKSNRNFKKFRIISVSAFKEEGMLFNYTPRNKKSIVSIWKDNSEKFIKTKEIDYNLNEEND